MGRDGTGPNQTGKDQTGKDWTGPADDAPTSTLTFDHRRPPTTSSLEQNGTQPIILPPIQFNPLPFNSLPFNVNLSSDGD